MICSGFSENIFKHGSLRIITLWLTLLEPDHSLMLTWILYTQTDLVQTFQTVITISTGRMVIIGKYLLEISAVNCIYCKDKISWQDNCSSIICLQKPITSNVAWQYQIPNFIKRSEFDSIGDCSVPS